MSRYVKRCAGECGQVRGVTAFKVVAKGERSALCRFCESNRLAAEHAARVEVRASLHRLSRRESSLRQQLATVAREKLALSLRLNR